VRCIMVGYLDDHSSDTYRMYDPMMDTVQNMQDVHWAVWKRTIPTDTMWIYASGNKPMAMAGALDEDQLPVMTMTLDDDKDIDSNDKVGRNVDHVNDNDDNDNDMRAMAIPAGRNATANGTQVTSASTTTAPAEPTARHVQFCDQPVRQLV